MQIMRKLVIILVLLSNTITAQSPIIDIEDYGKEESISGAYYKDIKNYFDDFTGTWIYTNGNTSLKIVLNKKTMRYTGKFYTDAVDGEYQYIENGVEVSFTFGGGKSMVFSSINDISSYRMVIKEA